MKKDYSSVLLGYRNYNEDEVYGKDLLSIDLVADWFDGGVDHTTEMTKEFFDFVEQEYGIDALIQKMKELHPKFPYDHSDDSLEEAVKYPFSNRDKFMHAADFKEAKIAPINK